MNTTSLFQVDLFLDANKGYQAAIFLFIHRQLPARLSTARAEDQRDFPPECGD
jgi:hypothetical protein